MAFYGQGLTEVTLPEGVLLVGRQAFCKKCPDLCDAAGNYLVGWNKALLPRMRSVR